MSVLRPVVRHYLSGCPHEAAHRALAEALDRAGLGERVVGISGVGCGSLVHAYLDLPFVASPAGRGISVARGLLLVRPELVPVVYGGDGELLGEGLSDLVRASAANAPLLVVLVDNQMQARSARVHSATTPLATRLPSCPEGREPGRHGGPLDPTALLGSLDVVIFAVSAADEQGMASAFQEGLSRVVEERRLVVLHVQGRCRGEEGDP